MPGLRDPTLIKILANLVSYKTETKNTKALNTCLDNVSLYLEKTTLHVKRFSSHGHPMLLASTKNTKTPQILLQAHLDVVPAKAEAYKLTEKDGKLYGRGVYDMKFAAACYLQLVADLKDNLADYDFGIMLTSDEEIGGENGVGYFLKKGFGAQICILPDGGDNWQIESTCNGVWIINLVAYGKSAHGSRPWEGNNAIISLLTAVHEIHDLFGELEPHKDSITISQIKGGLAVNQVPDCAEATLDMRFISQSQSELYKRKIAKIAKKRGLKLETIAAVEGSNIDLKQPDIARFIKTAQAVYGKPIKKTHSLGASDARYFAAAGISTIIMRPEGGGAHGDKEWIDKSGLFKFYELLKAYVASSKNIDNLR